MKLTKDWLDIHLKSKKKESQIIDKLNNIGLEVEKIEPIKNGYWIAYTNFQKNILSMIFVDYVQIYIFYGKVFQL